MNTKQKQKTKKMLKEDLTLLILKIDRPLPTWKNKKVIGWIGWKMN